MLDLLARSIVPFVRGALAGSVVGFLLVVLLGLFGVEFSWEAFTAGTAVGAGAMRAYFTADRRDAPPNPST